MPDNTPKLIVRGREWTGWLAFRVTRGIERMPSDFEVAITETNPNGTQVDFRPGDDVVVKAGNDVLLTGYIDRWAGNLSPRGHTISISGRGKCQDLVDCSAEYTAVQVNNGTALDIAKLVASPFGIKVTSQNGPGEIIPQMNTALMETPWGIIDRITRYSAFLAYEDAGGDLVMAQAGLNEMASGFAEGVNVQDASALFSADQRFSVIVSVIQAVNNVWQIEGNGPVGISGSNIAAQAVDKGVKRFRPHVVVSEAGWRSLDIAKQRAAWEAARRYGRSQVVTLTCDSWRDSDGRLWEPNRLALLDLPSLKIYNAQWIIAEVTFSVDPGRGTVAVVTLMPREGFLPEPILLQQFDGQVAADMGGSVTEPPRRDR